MNEQLRTFEVIVPGYADLDETLADSERVALLLCPDPEHDGACEIPWSMGSRTEAEEENPLGEGSSVVAAIYATRDQAERTAKQIGDLLGRPAHLVEAADYEYLVEQYRIERGLTD